MQYTPDHTASLLPFTNLHELQLRMLFEGVVRFWFSCFSIVLNRSEPAMDCKRRMASSGWARYDTDIAVVFLDLVCC